MSVLENRLEIVGSFAKEFLPLSRFNAELIRTRKGDYLNLHAGAKSLINEVYHQDGEKTRFTGTIKVKNASITKAIWSNLKQAFRFIESEAKRGQSAG